MEDVSIVDESSYPIVNGINILILLKQINLYISLFVNMLFFFCYIVAFIT